MRELNNPDHVLEYIIKDCQEAISANPLGAKTEIYLKLARACQAELYRRQAKRAIRKDLTVNTDVLTWRSIVDNHRGALKSLLKHWRQARSYDIEKCKNAALDVGLRKLHLQ